MVDNKVIWENQRNFFTHIGSNQQCEWERKLWQVKNIINMMRYLSGLVPRYYQHSSVGGYTGCGTGKDEDLDSFHKLFVFITIIWLLCDLSTPLFASSEPSSSKQNGKICVWCPNHVWGILCWVGGDWNQGWAKNCNQWNCAQDKNQFR